MVEIKRLTVLEFKHQLESENKTNGVSWERLRDIVMGRVALDEKTRPLNEIYNSMGNDDHFAVASWLNGLAEPTAGAMIRDIAAHAAYLLLHPVPTPEAAQKTLAALDARSGVSYRVCGHGDDTGAKPFSSMPFAKHAHAQLGKDLGNGELWLKKTLPGDFRGDVVMEFREPNQVEKWNSFVNIELGTPTNDVERLGVALRKLEESQTDGNNITSFQLLGSRGSRTNIPITAAEFAFRLTSPYEGDREGLHIEIHQRTGETYDSAASKETSEGASIAQSVAEKEGRTDGAEKYFAELRAENPRRSDVVRNLVTKQVADLGPGAPGGDPTGAFNTRDPKELLKAVDALLHHYKV